METDGSLGIKNRNDRLVDAASAAQDGPQSAPEIADDKEVQGEGAHLSKKGVDPKESERDSSVRRQEHSVGCDGNDSPSDRFIEDHGPSRRFSARARCVLHHDDVGDNHEKDTACA